MGINKNHEFEELDGIKCCIVEKAVTAVRADFLKTLLQGNGYTVVVSGIVPKTVSAPAPAEGEDAIPALPVPTPTATQFTVGVTDMTFNSINAVFGRLLRTKEGDVVTLKYWKQEESVASDVPYYS